MMFLVFEGFDMSQTLLFFALIYANFTPKNPFNQFNLKIPKKQPIDLNELVYTF